LPTGPRAFSNPRHRSRGPATGGAFPPRRPPIAGEGDSGAADPHPTARGAGGPGRGLAPGATRGPPFLSPEVPPPGEGALPIGAERTERGGGWGCLEFREGSIRYDNPSMRGSLGTIGFNWLRLAGFVFPPFFSPASERRFHSGWALARPLPTSWGV